MSPDAQQEPDDDQNCFVFSGLSFVVIVGFFVIEYTFVIVTTSVTITSFTTIVFDSFEFCCYNDDKSRGHSLHPWLHLPPPRLVSPVSAPR